MGDRTSAQIRAALDHPVVDADGHLLESVPALAEYVREYADGDCAERVVAAAGFMTLPSEAPLQVVLGSDVGHWDVPDMAGVLAEAYELVEDGVLDAARFRAFSCDNAIRLHGGANPGFFEGTAVADYARERLAASQGSA